MTKTRDVDMSPKAVEARLEAVRELYRLGMSLKHAGRALRKRDAAQLSTDSEKRGS